MNISRFYKNKIYPNLHYLYTTADARKYRRFAGKLPEDFRQTFSGRFPFMTVEQGEYTYDYFNFCYMHNVLSLMVYCLYHKRLPLICINRSRPETVQWSWYFQQPFASSHSFEPPENPCICPRSHTTFLPGFGDIYDRNTVNLWGRIYQQCVIFNEETRAYTEGEYRQLLAPHKRVLGVICRGTDYVSLKPAGHPVQPETGEVIEHCRFQMEKSGYDAIYLATEERKIRDEFARAFPGKILENKRVYYDDIYYSDSSIQYIRDVRFQRENNNYLSGLEYLSSIHLLSKCTSLIGGNCTGTMGAVFMNRGRYEYLHIFDRGLYP